MSTSVKVQHEQLLRKAAQILKAQQPKWQVNFKDYAATFDKPFAYLARFDWPGVVSVHLVETGALVVRSLPGQPFTVDPSFEFQAPERAAQA